MPGCQASCNFGRINVKEMNGEKTEKKNFNNCQSSSNCKQTRTIVYIVVFEIASQITPLEPFNFSVRVFDKRDTHILCSVVHNLNPNVKKTLNRF